MDSKAVTRDLLQHILTIDDDCLGIDLIISFIKLSGYRRIEPLLIQANERKIPVRILTSTYMNITDPAALLALFSLLGQGSVRLYNGPAPSFHPKAYFFKYHDKVSRVFVGSSNLSEIALTHGVEWNYEIDAASDPVGYRVFADTFEDLYASESYELNHDTILDYRRNYQCLVDETMRPVVNLHYHKNQQHIDKKYDVPIPAGIVHPNEAQTEALIELKATREAGNQKAIVVAATGVGKTYLAVLDADSYRTVLFIAHREEILNQSYHAFLTTRKQSDLGRLYAGFDEPDKSVLFASVQSLSRSSNLLRFTRDYFQYIIIDEFHHASAHSYQKILDYFQPEFLLGLTATPHRMDKKNIFEICDFNMVYEADLFSAINRGWLCPFQYMGIFDDTVDFARIRWINGKYVEKDLEIALSIKARAILILRHYKAHKRKRTLAFCSTIAHADYMAEFFSQHGIRCACVHSNIASARYIDRGRAIEQLTNGQLDVIFSVDMLQEGVDIPTVDLLLFLRPTESATVFLQQLGRGLRLAEGKRDLKVLDFIGNYKKVDLIPFLLSRQQNRASASATQDMLVNPYVPHGCSVHFDLQTIDLLMRILQSKLRIQDRIKDLFLECQSEQQRLPSRTEFYNFLETSRYLQIKSNHRFNPFRDFNSFLHTVSPEVLPTGYMNSNAHRLIRLIESTSMSTLYKIPCIMAFLRDGVFYQEADQDHIAHSFWLFYQNERNAIDLKTKRTRMNFNDWTAEDYFQLARTNPIRFLSQTHSEAFAFDPSTSLFKITLNIGAFAQNEYFLRDLKDALSFRRNEFIDIRLEYGVEHNNL